MTMTNPGARRPGRKARRPRILGIFEEEATQRAGMPRPGVGVEITVPGDCQSPASRARDGEWQRHGERRAAAHARAVRAHRAAMGLGEMADDRQAETEAAVLSCGSLLAL